MANEGHHEESVESGHPFWPVHVIDQGIQFYLWIGLILTVALLAPIKLHEKADPMVTPPGIKPEWYFLSVYQALKYVPEIVGLCGMGLLSVVTVFWPFIDNAIEGRRPGRLLHRRIVAVAIIFMIALGFLGFLSERTFSIFGRDVEFDVKAIPHSPHHVEAPADPGAAGEVGR